MKYTAQVRKAVEKLYDGTLTAYEIAKTVDPDTGITSTGWAKAEGKENIPCHLAKKSITAAGQTGTAATIAQEMELITNPDIRILDGSRIEVTQEGKTQCYECTGEPAVYSTHQEIHVLLSDRWA